MKVKEILNKYKEQYVEYILLRFKSEAQILNSYYIEGIELDYPESVYKNLPVAEYELMGEDDYNSTILDDLEPVDFEEWYGTKNAKVLVIVLAHDTEIIKYSKQSAYDHKNTKSFSIKLNKKTDKEILDWLSKKTNKQGAIKEALRVAAGIK